MLLSQIDCCQAVCAENGGEFAAVLYPPGSLFQIVSIQIEQDKSEVLRKLGPERGIADIVGHISNQQAAGNIDHLSNEVLLREGIDSVTLLFARRRIDHGPDVFILSNTQVSDMVIMVIQAAAGRLNMQVVMTGRLAGVVLSHPQPCLLLNQQPLAGPEPPCLPIGSSGTGFPPPGSSVHISRSISLYPFG